MIFFFSKGKLEALAILLQKLRSENRRVLIFTQMVKMLDILETFLDYRQLSYVRVDESFTPDEREVNSPPLTLVLTNQTQQASKLKLSQHYLHQKSAIVLLELMCLIIALTVVMESSGTRYN